MRNTTLIRNLQAVVDNIASLDLPAEINEIHAYGSILREKENPNDLDLQVMYTQTPEQTYRWEKFRSNFSSDNIEQVLGGEKPQFLAYQARGISLYNAVKNEQLAKVLREREIEPNWAGCFTWSNIFGYNPYGFYPSLEKVLKKMIFERHKGFSPKFAIGKTLPDGFIPLTVIKNHSLAWSKEKPDIETNILGRSIDEKTEFNIKELDYFLGTEIPKYRQGYLKAKGETVEKVALKNLALNYANLESKHIIIQRNGCESFEELKQKLELSRMEMEKYQNERDILQTIANCADGFLEGYSKGEFCAHVVIMRSKRRGIPEEQTREILRCLGIPEDHIVPINKYGFGVRYELAKTAEEKAELLAQASYELNLSKLIKPVIKTVRSFDKRAEVRFEQFENKKPMRLTIVINIMTEELSEVEKRRLEDELRSKGFTIRQMSWYSLGIKSANLIGSENSKELKQIATRMMTSLTN